MKKNLRFAVIDIETTGGRADRDRITEIGIVITDGNTVFDSFESLVNPEMGIPPYITQLTGIDNEMVEDAPRFYEIAKKIVELTEDTIFVAHNVRFDYGFIQEEFRRLGYSFSKKKICTVVMSRKAFPGLKSYSLGNLIRYFNIPAERRHRALDDAQATSTLLSYILESQSTSNEIYRLVRDLHQESLLPAELPADKINALPEVCGVYYCYDKYGEIAYIGKALNIRKRIWEHFKSIDNKGNKMQNTVADISFIETRSELAAYLTESFEIKKYQPYLNKASRIDTKNIGVYMRYKPEIGAYFSIEKKSDESDPDYLHSFRTIRLATKTLNNLIREFGLCPDVSMGNILSQACFDSMIDLCAGVCCGKEEKEAHQKRLHAAALRIGQKLEGSWFLVDEAPSYDEMTVFYIDNGIYKGYCVVSNEENLLPEAIIDQIKIVSYHTDYQIIIKKYFKKKSIRKIRLS